MGSARRRAGIITRFVEAEADADPFAGHTVAISAGGIADPRAALVIASPPRRFPLFGLVLPRLLVVAGISLAIASLAALALSRHISAPIQRLTEAANAMAAGQLEQAVPGEGPDELGQLVGSFNAMSRQVATAARSQRELLANVAHELRTPLTSVQGYAQALRDGVLTNDQEREQALAVIGREVERMASLIGQLLDLARLESGQAQLRLQPVPAAGLLSRVTERFAPEANSKGVRLITSAEPDLMIQGDEDRLLQLVSNLVSNALRHTPSGGSITLSASPALAVGREAQSQICLTVADTGEGIPSEILPRVFDRFVRAADNGLPAGDAAGSASGTGQRGRPGFGLGLAIVREIVALHGGTITVASQVGQGTTFTVHLPAAAPQSTGRDQPLQSAQGVQDVRTKRQALNIRMEQTGTPNE
jgi:two-component system sensor histidine kinase BaeS